MWTIFYEKSSLDNRNVSLKQQTKAFPLLDEKNFFFFSAKKCRKTFRSCFRKVKDNFLHLRVRPPKANNPKLVANFKANVYIHKFR
jgi:hypothetical protein